MPMKNPVHPGAVVREMCLEPYGLTVTAAASRLGVARQTLNNLVNERASLSPEMAVRLAKAFGGRAEFWLRLQMQHDVAGAERLAPRIKVARVRMPRRTGRAA